MSDERQRDVPRDQPEQDEDKPDFEGHRDVPRDLPGDRDRDGGTEERERDLPGRDANI